MTESVEIRPPPASSGVLSLLRTLFVLGRVSNLPTVWSNLLVGWLFGVGALHRYFAVSEWLLWKCYVLLVLGGSLIYVGGMYLNDFCDVAFDSRYCPDRPIPAGSISRRTVGLCAILFFALGLGCIAPLGWLPLAIAVLLVSAVVLYDFRHKDVAWAPPLMGFCRALLYFLGASTLPTWPPGFLWGWAMAMGLYVCGITYFARGEKRPQARPRWPMLLLISPVVYTAIWFPVLLLVRPLVVESRTGFWLFFLVFLLGSIAPFVAWLTTIFVSYRRSSRPSIGYVVSGLLAGLVVADVMAILPEIVLNPPILVLVFFFFILSIFLQRFIPAT